MTKDGRGLHFLVGIGVMWLFWRLLITGVLHDVGFLAVESEQAFRGPGAIVVAFVLEAVIAVGAVSVLLLSGVWDAAYAFGVLAKDAFSMGTEYLAAWQIERQRPADEVPLDDVSAADIKESHMPAPTPNANPLIGAIIDTREQLQRQQQVIERIAAKMETLDAKPEAAE